MRALVLSGDEDGSDVPPAILASGLAHSLRDAGHHVVECGDNGGLGAGFDVVVAIGTVTSAPDAPRRIAWLPGASVPGPGRWDRVLPADAVQARGC